MSDYGSPVSQSGRVLYDDQAANVNDPYQRLLYNMRKM